MANNKIYSVIKDGVVLKDGIKNLISAKALAKKENAEVFCGGECVYRVQKTEETPLKVTVKEAAPIAYRLNALMNVRQAPSMNATKLGTLPKGSVVLVRRIENNWLETENGYILYEKDGVKFAEKTDV